MHRAVLPPRPHLLGDVGQEGGEQPEQRREGEGEGPVGRRCAFLALAAVGPALDQLEVVVAEGPEEGLGALQGAGVVVVLEAGGRLLDHVGQPPEHGPVEGGRHVLVACRPDVRQHELRRVENLDGEPAAHLELVAVELEVAPGAGLGRPVAHGVGTVGVDEVHGVVG